jgi:seryl-tRNA synthetase
LEDEFMARTKQTISIDEKIEKAQEAAEKTKEKYEAAVKELRILMDKKDALKKQELFKAIENSNKSFEEILNFLKTNDLDE